MDQSAPIETHETRGASRASIIRRCG